MKIMVIADDALNRKLMRTVLESGGHHVVTAKSEIERLPAMDQVRPDLVIMDVQMPEGNEFKGIQRLRQNEKLSSLPVIALTAMAMKGDRERILQAGFDYYIAKPIRYREVLDLLASIGKGKANQS